MKDMFSALIQLLHEPMESGDEELTREDRHFCESSLLNLIKGYTTSSLIPQLLLNDLI